MFGMFFVDYRLSLIHWILINIIILITSAPLNTKIYGVFLYKGRRQRIGYVSHSLPSFPFKDQVLFLSLDIVVRLGLQHLIQDSAFHQPMQLVRPKVVAMAVRMEIIMLMISFQVSFLFSCDMISKVLESYLVEVT